MTKPITYFAVFLTAFTSYLSCRTDDQHSEKINPAIKEDPVISSFLLPIEKEIEEENSILTFYYYKPFDTTFVIKIWANEKNIDGVCYSSAPSDYNGFESFSDQSSNLFLFDGARFKLKYSDWNAIESLTNKIISLDSAFSQKACFDCATYYIKYNSNSRSNNSINTNLFIQLKEHLSSLLLRKFYLLRENKQAF
jgi:hypothetical protein